MWPQTRPPPPLALTPCPSPPSKTRPQRNPNPTITNSRPRGAARVPVPQRQGGAPAGRPLPAGRAAGRRQRGAAGVDRERRAAPDCGGAVRGDAVICLRGGSRPRFELTVGRQARLRGCAAAGTAVFHFLPRDAPLLAASPLSPSSLARGLCCALMVMYI